MEHSHQPLRPAAEALIRGGASYPGLSGAVSFTPTAAGVLVMADLEGLPTAAGACSSGIFALHIHEGSDCGGEAFSDAGGHWNPAGCPHPYHAGDLPPVFATASGRGFLAVLTDRFSLPEVVGHTVILHGHLDDFTTQPSGGAGEKIACGVIRRLA